MDKGLACGDSPTWRWYKIGPTPAIEPCLALTRFQPPAPFLVPWNRRETKANADALLGLLPGPPQRPAFVRARRRATAMGRQRTCSRTVTHLPCPARAWVIPPTPSPIVAGGFSSPTILSSDRPADRRLSVTDPSSSPVRGRDASRQGRGCNAR